MVSGFRVLGVRNLGFGVLCFFGFGVLGSGPEVLRTGTLKPQKCHEDACPFQRGNRVYRRSK